PRSRAPHHPLDSLLLSRTLLPFSSYMTPPTTDIYTLSLHDALPIWPPCRNRSSPETGQRKSADRSARVKPETTLRARSSVSVVQDRKSTRLNSSHQIISYAVFCLKKKKKKKNRD